MTVNSTAGLSGIHCFKSTIEQPKLLYRDIHELIDFRGIKENKIASVMSMSYNNWYKTKKKNLSNLTLDEIDQLATFLDLPAAQVFSLCYAVHKRAQQEKLTTLSTSEAAYSADVNPPK